VANTKSSSVVVEPKVVEAEVVAEEAPAPAVVQEEVVLAPATKKGTVTSTWTLYYANVAYDFVADQEYDLPVAVYEYLRKAGNLKATL